MCLVFNKSEPTHSGLRVVWKVLRVREGQLISPFHWRFIWTPGVNISSRTDRRLMFGERFSGEVDTGIHVYTNKYSAMLNNIGGVIVKVSAHAEDFIAENTVARTAAYMNVFLTTSEYRRALGQHYAIRLPCSPHQDRNYRIGNA
jgi:hypothetical protein